MSGIKRFFTVILFISFSTYCHLQQHNPSEYLKSPKEIIRTLEEQNSVRIFYKPEWIKVIDPSIISLSLEKAISRLESENSLQAFYLHNYIILTPGPGNRDQLITTDREQIVIGDPAELGRYSTVQFSGRIKDGQTGEALPGAVIYSEAFEKGISTDREGKFSINLPVGEHHIIISYIGYENTSRRVNIMGPGNFDFEIFEESLKLDEVTVRAKRAGANLTQTRMSMITMDSRSIKELPGTMGEQDIIRSMALLPGVQSTGEFGTGFHVRGGSADQNLILLEDVPLFNSSHLFGLTSVVNPDMVTDITLIKAGIPAKYGERASSVMDIRIKPESADKTSVRGGIGILNSRLHLVTPVGSEKIQLSAGGRTSYSNWLLGRMRDHDLMNSSAGFYDFTGTLSFLINPRNTITIFGYRSNDNFSFAGNDDYQYGNTLASMRWNSVMGEKVSFSLSGGLSQYEYQVAGEKENNPLQAYKLNSSIDYRTLKGNLMYFPDTRHSIELGVQAVNYHIRPGELNPLEGSEVLKKYINHEDALELAVYLSDNFQAGQNLSIEAGLRYTNYIYRGKAEVYLYDNNLPKNITSITDTLHFQRNQKVAGYGGLEPRFSVRYSLDDNSSLKASYSRINQYINLISNTSVITPSDLWKLSDTYLQPLQSDQYALGYFMNLSDNRIETSVEVYYKDMKNALEYKEGATIIMNEAIETDVVNATGYNYGIEIYAKKNSGRLTGWVSYTFSSSMRRSKGIFSGDMINDNKYFPSNYDKPHDIVINTNYNISRRWVLGGTFTYNTGRPVTLPVLYFNHGTTQLVRFSDRNMFRLPDYHRLDISITRNDNLKINQRGKGNWTFSLVNVYSRKNAYSIFYEKAGPSNSREGGPFNLYKLYIIGRILPTLSYNFTF
jgi:hypothetical protein